MRKNLSKLMKKTEIRRKQLLVTSASGRRSIHFRSFVVRSQVFGQSGRSYRLSVCRAKITWFGCFCFYSEDAKTFLMKSEENSSVKNNFHLREIDWRVGDFRIKERGGWLKLYKPSYLMFPSRSS